MALDNFRNSFPPQRHDSQIGRQSKAVTARVERHRQDIIPRQDIVSRQDAVAASTDKGGSSNGPTTTSKPVWRKCKVCQKKATIMCHRCSSVFYCSRPCWEIHQPQHDLVCWLPESPRQGKGRKSDGGFMAWCHESHPSAATDVRQAPVEATGMGADEDACNFCGGSRYLRYTGCGDANYCSRECQEHAVEEDQQSNGWLRTSASNTSSSIRGNGHVRREAQTENEMKEYLYYSTRARQTSEEHLPSPGIFEDGQVELDQHEYAQHYSEPLEPLPQPFQILDPPPVRRPMTLAEIKAALQIHIRSELARRGGNMGI